MSGKVVAAAVVLGATLGLILFSRSTSRAEAATSGCFSAAPGPSQPTLCS